jgi:hypothetical protein
MKGQRTAFSILEILGAILVLSLALLTLYGVFVNSSKTVSSSRYQYMALLIARELFDELRQTPLSDWTSFPSGEFRTLAGKGVFEGIMAVRGTTGGTPSDIIQKPPKYPGEYSRFKYRIDVAAGTAPDDPLRKVTVTVKWQEYGGGRGEKDRPGLATYVTLLGNHSTDPEAIR